MTLTCPRCSRDHLMIRKLAGVERLLAYWTGKRGFVCRACDLKFRAPDRRRHPRPAEDANPEAARQ